MKNAIFTGILAFLLLASVAGAAELLQNPGLESWTGGAPDDWTIESGITATQETSTIHGGTSSANITWDSTSTQEFEQTVSINSGADYSYSIWVLDNDPGGRVRLWIRHIDQFGSITGTSLDSSYSEDNADWQQLNIATTAAPADAVEVEFQVRFYDDTGWTGSATIYIDDISMQGDASDLTPPADKLVRVVDSDTIEITFNEDLDETSAETGGNYSVDNSVGSPSAATLSATDAKIVTLDFASALPSGVLTITINGVEDLASNPTNNLTAQFFGNIKAPGDVDDVDSNGEQVYEGVYATVRGLVIVTEINPDNLTIVGVSENDGIEVRNNAGAISGIARGDKVVVAGKVNQYNGLAQVQGDPIYYTVEESGLSEPTPETVGIVTVTNVDEEGANAFSGEPYEGDLVKIGPVTIGNNLGGSRTGGDPDADGLFDSGANYEIQMGSMTGVMRIDADTPIPGNPIPSAAMVTGVIQQYDYTSPYSGYYSIFPRDMSDFEQPTSVRMDWNLYE